MEDGRSGLDNMEGEKNVMSVTLEETEVAPPLGPAPPEGGDLSLWGRAYRRFQLLKRRLHVYAVAGYMKFYYHWVDRNANALPRKEKSCGNSSIGSGEDDVDKDEPVHPDYAAQEDEIYREAHTKMADFVFHQIVSLQGLWIKLGQYMGSRPDVLPEPWVHRLKELCDRVPEREISEVLTTVARAYGIATEDVDSALTQIENAQVELYSKQRQAETDNTDPPHLEFPHYILPKFGPFTDLHTKALATASIAQVHRARLGGEEIVLKVQHAGIAEIIEQDLENAQYLCNDFASSKKEYAQLPAVLKEWSNEMRSELNFVLESKNTEMVRDNLIKGGFIKPPSLPPVRASAGVAAAGTAARAANARVSAAATAVSGNILDTSSMLRIPRVIRLNLKVGEKMYSIVPTTETLVLEYIDGVKPTDEEALATIGLGIDSDFDKQQRKNIVETISKSFAQQIFADGVFSGDPHPGNILIEKCNVGAANAATNNSNNSIIIFRPVLLDFGLTKHVPNLRIRLAFCRLVVSAHEQDISGLLAAMRDMGFGKSISLARPEMALKWIQFYFRESRPDEDYKTQWKSAPKGGEGLKARAKREKQEDEMEILESDSEGEDTPKESTKPCASDTISDKVFSPPNTTAEIYFAGEKTLRNNKEISFVQGPSLGDTSRRDDDAAQYDDADDGLSMSPQVSEGANTPKSSKSPAQSPPKNFVGDEKSPARGKEGDQSEALDEEDTIFENEKEDDSSKTKDFEGLSTIFFLLRVVGLLRGLAVKLDVQHSYLEAMAPLAKKALRDGWKLLEEQEKRQSRNSGKSIVNGVGTSERTTTQRTTTEQLVTKQAQSESCSHRESQTVSMGIQANSQVASGIQAKFQYLSTSLISRGLLLGASICAFHEDRMILDLSFGEKGVADPRSCSSQTLFNAFSCSKILPVMLIHIFLDRGWIASLDDDLSLYWDEWRNGTGRKAYSNAHKKVIPITVRMALEHRAGLASAFPSKLAVIGTVAKEALKGGRALGPGAALRGICNWEKMSKWIATAKPNPDKINVQEYHAISHGWILGGLAEAVAKKQQNVAKNRFPQLNPTECTYEHLVRRFILVPLRIEDDVKVRIASSGQIIASHKMHEEEAMELEKKTKIKRSTNEKQKSEAELKFRLKKAEIVEDRVASLALHSRHVDRSSDLFGGFADNMDDENQKTAKTAQKKGEESPQDGKKPEGKDAKKTDRNRSSLFTTVGLDPRIFNDPTVRSGILPAANTHFTARGLATVFQSLLLPGEAEKSEKMKLLSEEYLKNIIYVECLARNEQLLVPKDQTNSYPLGFRLLRNSNGEPVLGAPGLVCNVGFVDVKNHFAGAVLVNQLDTEAEATDQFLKAMAEVCSLVITSSNDGNLTGSRNLPGSRIRHDSLQPSSVPFLPWKREMTSEMSNISRRNNQ